MDTRGRCAMLRLNAMSAPLLSVIVVCKNPGRGLAQTLASVWAQRDFPSEIVVVDGASNDGSHAWLENERSRIGVVISEPDRGVYDAMNKGIAAAHGEWVLFLGADDRLASNTVLAAVSAKLNDPAIAVAVGEATYDDGRVYGLAPRIQPVRRNFSHHQATFYRRQLFLDHGIFDPGLAIMADYDFNLRLWQRGVRFVSLPQRVARCGSGGLSDAGRWRGYAEEIRVRHRHFSSWRCWFWDALSVVRFLRKKILRRLRPHG